MKRDTRRARRPTAIGTALTLTPIVVGPHELAELGRARIDDVLTMMASLANPEDAHLGLRAFEVAATIDSPAAPGYTDLVVGTVSPAVRALLEELMRIDPSQLKSKYAKALYASRQEGLAEGREEGRAEGRQEGREEGRASLRRALRAVLHARGLSPSADVHGRIEAASAEDCQRWLTRAATAQSLDDVFD